ncbi:MAG TPA: hypothetical protein VIG32_05705 [Candidatus Baltobacteraceae bacterium]|jgi:hypothetical protein
MIRRKAGVLACAVLLMQSVTTQASAAPIVIRQLGHAPLLGTLHSTNELQTAVLAHQALFHQAATLVGMSPAQYRRMISQIEAGNVKYVTIPRHLERMTWAGGGPAQVLSDVVIPAGTKGWEIDLQSGRNVTVAFIPAICGNLSIVHRRLPAPLAARQLPIPPQPTPAPFVPEVTPAPIATPPPQTIVETRRPGVIVPLLGLLGLFLILDDHNPTFTPPPIVPTPMPCPPQER